MILNFFCSFPSHFNSNYQFPVHFTGQEVFQLFKLDMFASLFSLVLTLTIGLLGTWTYSRYSGNFREAAKWIDGLVGFGFCPFYLCYFLHFQVDFIYADIVAKAVTT
jgi:ABC-type sulfate transport system permease component